MSGISELEHLDDKYRQVKPSGIGEGFQPIPTGTKVRAVVTNQKPSIIGDKQTSVCKVTFEVVEPSEFKGKKVFFDLWLTEKNLANLKRDLSILSWPGQKLVQLMNESDTSLMCCGAEMTVTVEEYVDGKGRNRKVNRTDFLTAPFRYVSPEQARELNDEAEKMRLPF